MEPTPEAEPLTAVGVDALAWDERGLLPAVVQDARTGEVLTLAWMNRESLLRTLESGETWFWSRSRQALWHKGETSGHVQHVTGLAADCDRDALVVRVEPEGPACHTGARTCFHQPLEGAPDGSTDERLGAALEALLQVVARRKATLPEGSYTTYLFRAGVNKVLKKVGEEATEVVIAAKEGDDDALAGEVADLLYHLAVLMAARGLPPTQVAAKLAARRKPE